jgi:hypothetical protein
LEQARQAFDLRYAEGQLITAPAVMEAAQSVSARLNDAYDRVRRLDAGPPDTASGLRDRAALEADLYQEIRDLRTALRAELGTPAGESKPVVTDRRRADYTTDLMRPPSTW